MNLQLQQELLRRYPKLFRKPERRPESAIPAPEQQETPVASTETRPLSTLGVDAPYPHLERPGWTVFDERGFECGDGWFDIVDRTPRTLVLMNDWGERTRVLRGQGKRYAHEERAWAWDSFTRRAQRRLEILTASLADAQLVRRHIDAIKEPPTGAYYHHPGLPEFNP